jgi:RNA polymerase sigma-70 factor, ECF subfamily
VEGETGANRPATTVGTTGTPDEAASGTGVLISAQEFARLFAAEAPRVMRVLRRLGIREADIEDVTQDVFLVVHRRASEFRGESSMRTWIYGIAVRTALAHRRKRRPLTGIGAQHDPGVAPEQQISLERAHAREVLRFALDRLPEGMREVFVLFELEHLSMRDVAMARIGRARAVHAAGAATVAAAGAGRIRAGRPAAELRARRARHRFPVSPSSPSPKPKNLAPSPQWWRPLARPGSRRRLRAAKRHRARRLPIRRPSSCCSKQRSGPWPERPNRRSR